MVRSRWRLVTEKFFEVIDKEHVMKSCQGDGWGEQLIETSAAMEEEGFEKALQAMSERFSTKC